MANNIDTEKYEGHTDDFIWTWKQYASHLDPSNHADRALIQDAPLLLAEVERLREGLQEIVSDFEIKKTDKWEMLSRIETILKGGEEE